MKPALRENQLQAPKHWQSFRQGPALAAALEQQLAGFYVEILARACQHQPRTNAE